MNKKLRNSLIGVGLAGATTTVVFFGSENVLHDKIHTARVNANVVLAPICHELETLIDMPRGTIAGSMRANSYDCAYQNLPNIWGVIAGDNYCGELDAGEYKGIFIGNRCDWGLPIEFFVDESSLSMAMPTFINDLIHFQESTGIYSEQRMKYYLSASSGLDMVIDGEWHGEVYDIDKAIALATAPTSTPITCDKCGFLPAVYSILLDAQE